MYLTSQIPLRTGAMSAYPYSAALEKLFEITPKYSEPFFMSKRVGNTLLVPREVVPLGKEDYRVTFQPEQAINCQIIPRDEEQASCIAQSAKLLLTGSNHILEAPTGWGKTFAGVAIACAVGQPTLIIVTKEDLVASWKKAILAAGYKTTDIGHIQAEKIDYEGRQFVIGMVQSLIKDDKYEADMYKSFGMVIFDEVHRMAADSFSIAAGLFPAKYRLGLSATPKRKDDKDPVLYAHIGKILVRGSVVPMAPKILVKKTGWKVPSGSHSVQEGGKWKKAFGPIPLIPGRMMPIFKLMGEDYARNGHIVEFALSAYNKGRTVVIMSDLLDGHLTPLFHRLCKAGIPGNEIGYYVSGKSQAELKANAHKRIILATKKMCSEGTDYEHWDTLVIATPGADVKQIIGRVMRKAEGKMTPIVLDLIDEAKIFSSFYYSRLKQYHSVGAEVVLMD